MSVAKGSTRCWGALRKHLTQPGRGEASRGWWCKREVTYRERGLSQQGVLELKIKVISDYVPFTQMLCAQHEANCLVGGSLNPFQSTYLTGPWSFSQYVVETGSEKVNYWLIPQVSEKARARTHSFWLLHVSDPWFHPVLTMVLCRVDVNSFIHLLNLKEKKEEKTLLNTYLSVIRSF